MKSIARAAFKLLALIAFVGLVLTGCARKAPDVSLTAEQTRAAIEASRPVMPPDLLRCKAEPDAPERPKGGDTDSAVAAYWARVKNAGQDCRNKVNGIRVILEGSIR